MRPRHDIIEIFSTFLEFTEERVSGWVSIPRLRRSMENCLQQMPELNKSAQSYALYWYKLWVNQRSSLAREHLSAYLQEDCYWAAQKIISGLANPQNGLSDCFQMGIMEIDKVIKGFQLKQGYSLNSYARATFRGVIIDSLRQRKEVDFYSDLGLLNKLSQTQLEKSLINAGINSQDIAQYWLAWTCFKTFYQSKEMTETHLLDYATKEAIAQRYNSERLNYFRASIPECTPEKLEKLLIQSTKWARFYLFPQVISLNQPKKGTNSDEMLNYLPSESDCLLTEIMIQEESQIREYHQAQVNQILLSALTQLNPHLKKILDLYYIQGLTQQEIAQQLNLKQYNVSRHLLKISKYLLNAIEIWIQQRLHISLTSHTLQQMNPVVQEWLKVYYKQANKLAENSSMIQGINF